MHDIPHDPPKAEDRTKAVLWFLTRASRELASSLDYHTTLNTMAQLVVPFLADWCVIDVLEADQSLRRVAMYHRDPEKVARMWAVREREPVRLSDTWRVPVRVLLTGRAEMLADIPITHWRHGETRERAREFGFRSYMILPMIARGRTLGVIQFFSAESERHYTADDLAVAEDVTQLAAMAVDNARLYGEAERAAFHDALTGLPNRTRFLQLLTRALERNREGTGVLFLDLDGFKYVNDALGHAMGDALLVAVSERLREGAGPDMMVARLGGDEFTVLLENLPHPAEVEAVAHRVSRRFREPLSVGGRELRITPSIGAVTGQWSEDALELLRLADRAMYHAKRQGKARHAVYDPTMDAKDAMDMALDLQRAVAEGELRLYYQPVVQVQTGKVVGVEALVRWQHPDWGLVGPEFFLKAAEESGVVVDIDHWVLEQACRQLACWRNELAATQHGEAPGFMSVNLSIRNFQRPGLLETVERILAENRLLPGSLQLELSEEVMRNAPQPVLDVLWELKRRGVNLVMDNFAQGNASLHDLSRLPVHVVKMAPKLVQNSGEGRAEESIMRAVMASAAAMCLLVCGKHITTASQWAYLQGLGCHRAQGFYFSPPLGPDEMIAWLRSQ